MNVKDEIRKAIKEGIYLGTMTDEEEERFIKQLFSFLLDKKNFCTLNDRRLIISVSSIVEDLADIYIARGTLMIQPLAAEGYFQVFMDVLEFVAKKHREEVEAGIGTPIEEVDEEDISTEEDDDGDWWL